MSTKKQTSRVTGGAYSGRLFELEIPTTQVPYEHLNRVLLPDSAVPSEQLRFAAHASVHSGLSARDDIELRRRTFSLYESMVENNTAQYFDYVNLYITYGTDEGLSDVYALLEKQRIALAESVEQSLMDVRKLYSTAIRLTQALPRMEHVNQLISITRMYSLSTLAQGFKPNGFEGVRNLAFELCSGDGSAVSRTLLAVLYLKYQATSLGADEEWSTPEMLEVDPRQFARAVLEAIKVQRNTTIFDQIIANRPYQYELNFGSVAVLGAQHPLELTSQ